MSELMTGEPMAAPVAAREPRPFYWSVRREIWENRFLYIAPLIVTGVVLFSLLVSVAGLPERLEAKPEPARSRAMVWPFGMAPAPIMFATLIVGVFYVVDALYGERRDRSLLFWKSLPVPDGKAVLAKLAIPMAVLPAFAWLLSVLAQLVLLMWSIPVFLGHGLSPFELWKELRFFEGLLIMAYGLTVHALWFAPVYGWLLLISAWAKRAPLLWAAMPLIALAAFERITMSSTSFVNLLKYRVTGAMSEAFVMDSQVHGDFNRLEQLTPIRFLTAPGLWAGLFFAGLFLAGAWHLRRTREPA